MKNRSIYGCVSAWLGIMSVVVAGLAFSGCNKRPYTRIKQLPIEVRLDWNGVAEADQEQTPSRLKMFLFQEDGTLRAQYDIPQEGLLRNEKVLLNVGVYRAIVVNVNDNVEVQNADKFETAQLVAKPTSAPFLTDMFSKADDRNEVVCQPGWIFSGSLPEMKVGDPITFESDTADVSIFLVPMARRMKTVHLKFTVTGIGSEIRSVAAALGGIASRIDLTSGEIMSGYQAISPLALTYASDGTAVLEGTMLIFGNEAEIEDALRNNLYLQFETVSGRTVSMVEDITDQMKKGSSAGGSQVQVEGNLDVRVNAGMVTIVITWTTGTEENLEGV